MTDQDRSRSWHGPSPDDLARLIQLVLESVDPVGIMLFGSAARGEMQGDSDIDLLVIVPDGTPRRRTAQRLYLERGRQGVRLPVEFHVATTSMVARNRDDIGTLYYDATREGRELYAAA